MSLPTTPPKQQIIDKINNYLQTSGNITAAEHKEIELLLVDAIYGAQIGDIKEIAANDAYIISNFQTGSSNNEEGKGLASGVTTPNGISTGERYGWAICNGKNGTINKKGKVAIGYDPSLYPLGSVAGNNTGGSKNAVLIGHEHDSIVYNNGQKGVNQLGTGTSIYGWAIGGGNATEKTNKTSKNGISDTGVISNNETGTDKNMQPYIVTLFIQRIPV